MAPNGIISLSTALSKIANNVCACGMVLLTIPQVRIESGERGRISKLKDVSDALTYVGSLQNRIPLHDFAELLDENHRIITFGDNHDTDAFKDEFIRILPQLRNAGIDTLAFESMAIFTQPSIDRYFDLKTTTPNMLETEAARKELSNHLEEFLVGSNEKLLEIVDAAKVAGMKMIAIEPDLPGMQKYPTEDGAIVDGLPFLMQGIEQIPASMKETWCDYYNSDNPQAARQKLLSFFQQNWVSDDATSSNQEEAKSSALGSEVERFMKVLDISKSTGLNLSGLKLPPPDQTEFFIAGINWRNETWKCRIEEALSRGSTGVVVFAGACHFHDNSAVTLNEMLERDGYASVAITCAGADVTAESARKTLEFVREYGLPPSPYFLTQLAILEVAARLELRQERFAVCTQDPQAHWLLHLPETS